MKKRSPRLRLGRPSGLVLAFGTLLGLTIIGYGWIMLFLRPAGIGPCRLNCGLRQAYLTFLGQPLYNLVFGLADVALGVALIAFLAWMRFRK
ncbi:hypothetical protein [Xanthomonas sp. 1678]|uniref:hypothetical protein n=1 Tax=Xanthomonas sp. 1678 TaxID=3158788 RepID=UPI0028620FAD|nr:hypothetical protein [Xanthomonas translucens]